MESNTDFFIIALFQLALNTKLFPTQGFVPFKRATCRYFNYVRGYSIPTKEPPVPWKFEYSSKKLRKNAQNLTLKVDISHLVTFWT